jgi:hypothetical protein
LLPKRKVPGYEVAKEGGREGWGLENGKPVRIRKISIYGSQKWYIYTINY